MNKNSSLFAIVVLFLLFDISLQQINSGVCVCQVNADGRNQWWTMNGWNQGTCNQYTSGNPVSMGTFTLINCVWKGGNNDRPVYGFKSVKNGKWCSADNYGQGPLICNRDSAQQWETFYVSDKDGNGRSSVQSVVSKKYIDYYMYYPYVEMASWQNKMEIRYVDSNGIVTIKAIIGNNLYLSVKDNNIVSLSDQTGLSERFYMVRLN